MAVDVGFLTPVAPLTLLGFTLDTTAFVACEPLPNYLTAASAHGVAPDCKTIAQIQRRSLARIIPVADTACVTVPIFVAPSYFLRLVYWRQISSR
jgi:hypothetical protein